jgi:hypothetical protein
LWLFAAIDDARGKVEFLDSTAWPSKVDRVLRRFPDLILPRRLSRIAV